MSRAQLPSKYSTDVMNVVFDYTSQLAIGETISTKTCTCTVTSGVDNSPGNVLNGAATSSGNAVTQSVKGGVTGVLYNIQCVITTSASQTLTMQGTLAVLPTST